MDSTVYFFAINNFDSKNVTYTHHVSIMIKAFVNNIDRVIWTQVFIKVDLARENVGDF